MLPFVSEDPDEHSHEVTKPTSHAAAYNAPSGVDAILPPQILSPEDNPEEYQIPFGANMGKRLKVFSRDELLEMQRKSGEYLKKTPRAAPMYVETDKALNAAIAGRLPF